MDNLKIQKNSTEQKGLKRIQKNSTEKKGLKRIGYIDVKNGGS